MRLFRQLPRADRRTLLAFAAFLAEGRTQITGEAGPLEPAALPRPAEETVVAAIRRLSKAYFMLEPSRLLDDTSALMSAHLLQGRPASTVIDELEAVFARHYAAYRNPFEQR